MKHRNGDFGISLREVPKSLSRQGLSWAELDLRRMLLDLRKRSLYDYSHTLTHPADVREDTSYLWLLFG